MTKSQINIIAGATATGKSAAAIRLAQKQPSVIINADSQQMFADLPILTARPTEAEMAGIPHKLYGILRANEQGSAGHWLRLAKMEIDWALAEGKTPIVVGGTGLYIKALMQGIAEIPAIPAEVTQQATNDFEQMGKDAFAARLREIDAGFFERLKVYDKQRLIRAYAVWLGSGKTLTHWQQQKVTPAYAPEQFSLNIIELPREELYARCDARFLQMIERGAVREVMELGSNGVVENPHHPTTPLLKIIGVTELTAYINGEISLDEAISKAQQATRNYAKRQVTWFKNQRITPLT